MSNRIRRILVQDRALVPSEAEVWITVFPDQLTPTTEVRGRLMGPKCRFANTVEVAYPLRPLSKGQQAPTFNEPALTLRVVIPEPSFWDPESPFLYQGPVELWQDGRRFDQISVRLGLRFSTLRSRGLSWNGRALPLRGQELTSCSEEDALTLRGAGYNLLLAPVAPETAALWDLADRIGFLLLGRLTTFDEPALADLAAHPSHLGWVIDRELWPRTNAEVRADFRRSVGGLIGVELKSRPAQPLASDIDFIVCAAEDRADLEQLGLPVLLLGSGQ